MDAGDSSERTSYVYNSQLDAFTLYHISQGTSRHRSIGPALPALGHATSGALGTAISKLITYPLDIVITRLQVQKQLQHSSGRPHYDGFLDAIEKIYEREGGLQAFYNGVFHETAKGVADSFLFFLAYAYVRQKRLDMQGTGKSLPALEEIGVGMVAGAFSKFWTTPIQNIITRKQTAAMLSQDSATTIPPLSRTRDIAWEINREKGLQGFWSGYSASLILTLNPSITMLLHKVLLRLLVPAGKRDDPGSRVTFLIAAISKALASTVTYPFSLAKTRAQVSSQKPTATTGETSESEKSDYTSRSRAVQARQRTVFSTIFRIAQTEGLLALYQGLGPEVLKGFFSHGITMLMKDRIHTAIISLYYTIVQSLEKAPSPETLAKNASDRVKGAYEQGKEQVSGAYAKGVEVAGNAADQARGVIAEGSQQAQDLVERGKEQASTLYSQGVQAADAASSTAQNALQSGTERASKLAAPAQDMIEKGKDVAAGAAQQAREAATNASEQAKTAATSASEQAKYVIQQADVTDANGFKNGGEE